MLIDFVVPGMFGAEVDRNVHSAKPTLPTPFITGDADGGNADHRALWGVSESHIIRKPFHPDALVCEVRVALVEAGGTARRR